MVEGADLPLQLLLVNPIVILDLQLVMQSSLTLMRYGL